MKDVSRYYWHAEAEIAACGVIFSARNTKTNGLAHDAIFLCRPKQDAHNQAYFGSGHKAARMLIMYFEPSYGVRRQQGL